MALYEFKCEECSAEFEKIVSKAPSGCCGAPAPVECPKCGSVNVRKKVSRIQAIKDFFCAPSG